VPVDPILGGQRPISQPITTPDVNTTSATAYRGYYYEIAQNLSGAWLWAVYTGVQQTWGLELILVSGGTSENYDDALFQVTGIIDNLSEDSDYTPPIQEDASIELVGAPEFGDSYLGMFDTQDTSLDNYTVQNGNGNGGGNGNGAAPMSRAPLFENFQFIGLVAVIGAVMLFKKQG
jgi:hypothetical protein